MPEPKEQGVTGEDKEALAELDSIKDLMHLVSNAARVFQSYPSNNQLYLKFAQQLGEKFSTHLAGYGDVTLSVGQYELMFNGEEVYSETNASRSLALKFYRDGVRRVRFLEGLESEEIVGFVEVLSQPVSADSLDNDIVTMLWEKDFSHIKYAVLEEIPAGKEEPGSETREKAPPGEIAEPQEEEAEAGPAVKPEYKDISTEVQEITEEVKNAVATLDEEALEDLQKGVQAEMESDIVPHVSLVLCDTVIMEKDPEFTASTVGLLGQLVRASIANGRLEEATQVLVRLKELESPSVGLSAPETDRARRELTDLGELGVLQQLAAIANENAPQLNQQLREFLLSWGEDAIGPATSLAGLVMHDTTIIEVLVELGREHADLCVETLRDPNPASVLVALKVLGEIGDASIVGHLRECLENPSPQIKMEAIRTLGKLGGEQALQLLELVLNDEDSGVRREAVHALGNLGDSRAVDLLESQISEKTFINKPMEEKRAALGALAQAGGQDVIPILEGILKSKRWFRAEKQNESRACAAYALGLLGNPEARQVLEDFEEDRSPTVQAACRAALSRITGAEKEKAGHE